MPRRLAILSFCALLNLFIVPLLAEAVPLRPFFGGMVLRGWHRREAVQTMVGLLA
jgi:hypothetical protein